MKKMVTVLCICFALLCFVSVNATAQRMLEGEALLNWYSSTLDKYSTYPEKKLYPAMILPTVKMAVSNWSMRENRYARVKISGTVNKFQVARGFVLITVVSSGMEEMYFGKDNGTITGIDAGDFLDLYVNYVFEVTPNGVALGEFVEMVDILDKPNAQQWVFNNVTYSRSTLQEALRLTRNDGNSGRTHNLWIRDIDFIFGGGYFLLKTGTTEVGLVEYYGEDLSNTRSHGGVLLTINCKTSTPKVTAIKFFEYPSQR
jgi:hypothetical protein